jgi:hypothetical protein
MIPRESEASGSNSENDRGARQNDGGGDSENDSKSSPNSSNDASVNTSSDPNTSANDISGVAYDTDSSNVLSGQLDTASSSNRISGEVNPSNDIPSESSGLDGNSSLEKLTNPYNGDDFSLLNDLPSSPFNKPSKDTNNDPKQLTSDGSKSLDVDPKQNLEFSNNPKSSLAQPEKGISSNKAPRLIDAVLSFGSKILDSLFGTAKAAPSPEKQASTVAPYLQPYAHILGVAGNPRLTPEVIKKIESIAEKYNQNPIDLMKVMSHESKFSFDPAQPGPKGQTAVGVLQINRAAAERIGTSPEALSKMTLEQQLDWVDKYLEINGGDKLKKSPGIETLYITVISPSSVGKPSNHVLFEKGSKGSNKPYKANKSLDSNKDGKITIKEAADAPRNRIIKPSTQQSKPKLKGIERKARHSRTPLS